MYLLSGAVPFHPPLVNVSILKLSFNVLVTMLKVFPLSVKVVDSLVSFSKSSVVCAFNAPLIK